MKFLGICENKSDIIRHIVEKGPANLVDRPVALPSGKRSLGPHQFTERDNCAGNPPLGHIASHPFLRQFLKNSQESHIAMG